MSYRRPGPAMLLAAGLLGCTGWAGAQMIAPPPVPSPQPVALPQGPAAPPPLEELDEAKVKATKLWQIRENMVALEEQFFARYNELNKNDDYDVHCSSEAPLGTRFKKRVCRIAYHEDAQAAEAQALLGGYSAPPASMVLLARYSDYEKNALAVINSDVRLRRLVREREELEKRYIAERKRRFKGKWILFE